MKSKNLLILAAFAGVLAFALGTRLLNRNSVFAAENFVKKESEKIDDLLEKQKLLNKRVNTKKGFIKPEIIPTNRTEDQQEEVYSINYVCPDGQFFDNFQGKCVELKSNNTQVMYSNHSTKTNTRVDANFRNNTVPCLNKTEDKYDDKVVDLTITPGKK